MPEWVTQAYEDYTRRMRSSMRIDLEELPVGKSKTEEEKRFLERKPEAEATGSNPTFL